MNFLIAKCHELEEPLGLVLTTNIMKTVTLSCPTESDELIDKKEAFMLKQIVYPYLCYLTKIMVIKEENEENLCEKNHQIWRLVNLLKNISSFTVKFMTIGRYYLR